MFPRSPARDREAGSSSPTCSQPLRSRSPRKLPPAHPLPLTVTELQSVRFSADGKQLYSGGDDGLLRVLGDTPLKTVVVVHSNHPNELDESVAEVADIDRALDYTLQARSAMGSIQNQLETVVDNLMGSIENFSASDSRIRDLDIASEAATLTQYQVLQNAAVGVLSQANRLPQMILGLLEARG